MFEVDFLMRDLPPVASQRLLLVDAGAVWCLNSALAPRLPRVADVREALEKAFFLGRVGDDDSFCLFGESIDKSTLEEGEWVPLRALLPLLSSAEFALAGRAVQLARWHKERRYCSRCGSRCMPHANEFAMVCPNCQLSQYPLINPCVIMLVTRGDKALLAHGVQFREPMFSCLAGFIEAGESAEAAVVREVKEEVGIDICRLEYRCSQPWPFPHSLMLGFRAQWAGGDIVRQPSEIVAAGWFSADNLPALPAAGSIARDLIDAWVAEQAS